ncbi:MAG TPA: sugar ABC transporter substrate-binding protein [Chloroflexota bacterium]|nr:sugar ABC transporter substrate-binding protein [Chloroflexota bacterium]
MEGQTRRAALAAGAWVAAGTALGACGRVEPAAPVPGGVPSKPIKLTHLNQGAGAAPGFFDYAVGIFQKQYPNVSVEYIPNAANTSVMEKFLALSAAGTVPDVVQLNPPYVEPLRARGALADLTPYVKRDAKTYQPEDFHEATLARAVRNGRWHAIPDNLGLWMLIYNTTAFQQVGAGKPDATWTWDRLVDVVRQVIARDTNVIGMSMPPYELPLRGNGGDILSKDEKQCTLDKPEAVEAIQWMGDLRQRQRVVPGPAEMGGQAARALFDNARIVAHWADPGFLNTTVRQKVNFSWDIATIPRGKAAHVSTVKGPSYSLSSEGKERDTAWAWLGHFTGPEIQKYRAVEQVSPTARKSGLKAYLDSVQGFTKQVFVDVAAICRTMPYIAKYDEMDKEISDGLDAVYSGQQPARTAMAEVTRKVNAILATIK